MQSKIPFNYEWYYKPSFDREDVGDTIKPEVYKRVDLPHTNQMLSYNYIDEKDYQFISCYKKYFTASKEWYGKDIFLDFEGVMLAAEVYLNGKKIGTHEGGYTPFSVDLTDAVSFEEENCITVKVDSTERKDIPPFGNVVDYLAYGGIYREVSLRIADQTRLERVFLESRDCLQKEAVLKVKAQIHSEVPVKGRILVLLADGGRQIARQEKEIEIVQGVQSIELEIQGLQGLTLWDVKNPHLYEVTTVLEYGDDRDEITQDFGFRESVFLTDGYYLNGRLLKLVGLNRHQSFPYVGYAMPKRVQEADAALLKKHAGINVVRCSHYPQSVHFLKECDRLGLLVIEEIPGWQFIGDEEWKKHSLQDVEDMIVRDYNHPSIILWGVRINESQDDHEFYKATNELARKLDETRQTGGTRYIQKSDFLEDVYTYNDFTLSGGDVVFRPQKQSTGLDYEVPTLVTESNGHMFPTKRFDHEARLVEHAIRHLRVIQEARGRDDLVGGISWCAFDYNTHGCFGSGDKICYHGVYDMFRNPKYAAFAYAAQKDPEEGVELEPITVASRGEKDGGGIVPFQIMTNCDYVKVYKNDKEVGDFYPDREKYPHLEHPPITVSHVMEKDADFGLSCEDMSAFKEFLIERIGSGAILNPSAEDMAYLAELAAKYEFTLMQLFGVVMKMAGGWGDKENNFRLEGYVNGSPVKVRTIGENKSAAALSVEADALTLYCQAETYDATRVTVKALDTFGNLMPFTQECVHITLEGPGTIMGPDCFALMGGISSFWVRTTGEAGKIRVLVKGMNEEALCELEVVPAI